jgi:MFS superfamily sulfate permease-like transporter
MTLFLRGTIYVGLAMACAIAVASQSQPAGRPAPRRNPSQQQQSRSAQQPSEVDQRGTENSPIVVKVLPAPKTPEEAAQERAARNDLSAANWWMVRLTGLIFFIGALQTLVFWIQATRLKKTIEKMDEIATGQTKDMRDSINAAARAADAMEGVAESLAQNVRDVQESVAISREIADRQKLITELGARAYLPSFLRTRSTRTHLTYLSL